MDKPINWFEIPALDLKRALIFYQRILGVTLQEGQVGEAAVAVFPYDPSENAVTGGCLVKGESWQPSQSGVIVYLNAQPIDDIISRVEDAGGRVLLPKTQMPGNIGYIAHIADTEGNRVGLHGVK